VYGQWQEESDTLSRNLEEARDKVQRMEYTYKKANRMLDVERRDLDHERTHIESNLSRNVRKIDSTLKRMESMREEKKKLASDVRSVAKRLTYEKDCVEHRLLFEKDVRTSFIFLPHLYFVYPPSPFHLPSFFRVDYPFCHI
jgi:hypothetical protein